MNKKTTSVGRVLALVILSGTALACYAQAQVGGDECRGAEIRNRRDVDLCVTRCIDDGCRTHCHDQERWSHEHNCWAD
jgi:hypothetical protein